MGYHIQFRQWRRFMVIGLATTLITCVILPSMMNIQEGIRSDIADHTWLLCSNVLPEDERFRATIGNGYIGAIVYHETIHVTGIYNGIANASTYEETSTHCKVPNPVSFRLNFSSIPQSTFCLDLYNGCFTETIDVDDWNITIRQYAHQTRKTLLVVDVVGVPKHERAAQLETSIHARTLNESDIRDMEVIHRNSTRNLELRKYRPLIQEDSTVQAPILTVVWTKMPEKLSFSIAGNNRWTFIMAAFVNVDDTTAIEHFHQAVVSSDSEILYHEHEGAWRKLWDDGGRIDVTGNDDLAQTIHAAFYYLLSSAPTDPYSVYEWPNFGLSPASLAHSEEKDQHYWGHIFWDQETWMLPSLVPFHPGTVRRIMIDTRVRRMDKAREKAQKMGFEGAMFPWEVGYSGVETTNWEPAASRELHITGDIAQFARQYLYWTGDKDFLVHDGGYDLFYQVATFWASRLSLLHDQNSYGVMDCMGPDEDHDHVNNSVYTNSLASQCLEFPMEFYAMVKNGSNGTALEPKEDWIRMAEKVFVPFDELLQYHPEYDGYANGTRIKQADVVLLGYPLLVTMNESVREKDLRIYEQHTRNTGPCMTWAIHSIGWLDLGDEEKASENFQRNFYNIRDPFKVWTENSDGSGASNFITGIGGFLQNILYGYLGLRVKSDRLEFNPKQIPNTTGYVVSNIKYHSLSVTVTVTGDGFQLSISGSPVDKAKCLWYSYSTDTASELVPAAIFGLGRYAIMCPLH